MARVMVMMSGGVDSSVAAALLRDEGHDVTGVTLKLWGGESDSGCCSVSDVEDARRVAAQLDIPHYVFNFSDDFDDAVVAPYVDAYAAGETPNPCVECNRTMKFGRVLERARQLEFDFVATGHHARIVATAGGPALARAADAAKDQSYVLYMLGPDELARTLLPIGELTKAEVREHARALGLRTADKRESMDVCFITRGGREAFLGARIPRRAGTIVDERGVVVGAHDGIDAFTIGQRRGLGVAVGERRYVTDISVGTATVTVGPRGGLLHERVRLRDAHRSRPLPGSMLVQFRAHGAPVAGAARRRRRGVRRAPAPDRAGPGRGVLRRRHLLRGRHRRGVTDENRRGVNQRGQALIRRLRACSSAASARTTAMATMVVATISALARPVPPPELDRLAQFHRDATDERPDPQVERACGEHRSIGCAAVPRSARGGRGPVRSA